MINDNEFIGIYVRGPVDALLLEKAGTFADEGSLPMNELVMRLFFGGCRRFCRCAIGIVVRSNKLTDIDHPKGHSEIMFLFPFARHVARILATVIVVYCQKDVAQWQFGTKNN